MQTHVMNDVLASALSVKACKALSRYLGTSFAGMRTESEGEQIVFPGMNASSRLMAGVAGREVGGLSGNSIAPPETLSHDGDKINFPKLVDARGVLTRLPKIGTRRPCQHDLPQLRSASHQGEQKHSILSFGQGAGLQNA